MVVPTLLVGLIASQFVAAPYSVWIQMRHSEPERGVEVLSQILEQELQMLGAEGVTVSEERVGDRLATGAGSCEAAAVRVSFALPRSGASAFYGRLPGAVLQSGGELCEWSYRHSLGLYDVVAGALGAGIPVVALILVLGLVRNRRLGHHRFRGVLPEPSSAIWWGLALGGSAIAIQIILFSMFVRFALPIEAGLDARFDNSIKAYWTVLIVVFCAPLVEEYGFRVRFLDSARKSVGPVLALFLSALAFSAFHTPGTVGTLIIGWAIGMLFGLLWLRTRSLLACWSAHASHNAVAIALTLRGFG